ncbi:MAG: Putative activity regulator of membrane protease YbbK, partial [uncultured Solirubrobacteraceae bacterium]
DLDPARGDLRRGRGRHPRLLSRPICGGRPARRRGRPRGRGRRRLDPRLPDQLGVVLRLAAPRRAAPPAHAGAAAHRHRRARRQERDRDHADRRGRGRRQAGGRDLDGAPLRRRRGLRARQPRARHRDPGRDRARQRRV